MKILYPVSLALGLTFTSASSAEQFVIDPLQSYIEVDLETWVQGAPWGFIDEESGELSVSVRRTHLFRHSYIEYESAGIQLNGSSSSRRRYGCVGSRVSTSLR